MDIVNELNDNFLMQAFPEDSRRTEWLEECKYIASLYARIENSIAVLSDLKTNTSYIYYGGMAERLGIAKRNDFHTVHSIWEEEIFSRIHPDDLSEKHLLELRFFHYLKGIPERKRADYYLAGGLRMRDASNVFVPVLHRVFYVASHSNGSVWLALCLYNLSTDTSSGGVIIDSANGRMLTLEKQTCNLLLSDREKDILQLIERGKKSRDIALELSISINTVNRHRQNILEKLQVSNSVEACRIARELRLF